MKELRLDISARGVIVRLIDVRTYFTQIKK